MVLSITIDKIPAPVYNEVYAGNVGKKYERCGNGFKSDFREVEAGSREIIKVGKHFSLN